MTVIYEERPSDSPFVQTIWHVCAVSDGADIVAADGSWDIIITHRNGKTELKVWGAMTQAALIDHYEGDEVLGIRFKLGAFMPHFPADTLVDFGIALPEATSKSFWLDGSAWQFPNFENVETFLARLARKQLLISDPVVESTMQGHLKGVSPRSIQRYFQRSTGLTQRSIFQIERARQAAALLQEGVTIPDTVDLAGYTDQPHLTKALKRYIGLTPAQIVRMRWA